MTKLTELRCDLCSTSYTRRTASVKYDLTRRPDKKNYCSRGCAFKAKELAKVTARCGYCLTSFSRKPNSSHDNYLYCSRTCGARAAAEKKLAIRTNTCGVCGEYISSRRKYCSDCKDSLALANKSLKELRDKYSLSQYHAKVRGNSRSVYRQSGRPQECYICNYDTHTDICHIKDVKDFSLDTSILEVNDIDNLVALCKNHHWEFDNGLITL